MNPSSHPFPLQLRLQAIAIPALLVLQIGLAGAALFIDAGTWALHATTGFVILLPIAGLALRATMRSTPGLRPRVLAVALLYVTQVTWAALGETPGQEWLRALHVANAGLLMLAATLLAAHVCRPS